MSATRDLPIVHFQQGHWAMIQGMDGLMVILDHGLPVRGCSWPISSLHHAVAKFRTLAGSTAPVPRKRVRA